MCKDARDRLVNALAEAAALRREVDEGDRIGRARAPLELRKGH
jgi:hypothetical protein